MTRGDQPIPLSSTRRVAFTIGGAALSLGLFAGLVRWMAAVESNQSFQKDQNAQQLKLQADMNRAINELTVEIGRLGTWHDAINQRLNRLEDRTP